MTTILGRTHAYNYITTIVTFVLQYTDYGGTIPTIRDLHLFNVQTCTLIIKFFRKKQQQRFNSPCCKTQGRGGVVITKF